MPKLQRGIQGNPGTGEPPNQNPSPGTWRTEVAVNKGDMVPPILNLTPSTKNLKPKLTTATHTYCREAGKSQAADPGTYNAMGTKDEC